MISSTRWESKRTYMGAIALPARHFLKEWIIGALGLTVHWRGVHGCLAAVLRTVEIPRGKRDKWELHLV
jgi:hypothetical protein